MTERGRENEADLSPFVTIEHTGFTCISFTQDTNESPNSNLRNDSRNVGPLNPIKGLLPRERIAALLVPIRKCLTLEKENLSGINPV